MTALKSSLFLSLLIACICDCGSARAADWRLADEVTFYRSAEPKSDKANVGAPLVNASGQERCVGIWNKIEERLAGADSYLILQIVPRYSCPLFIRAIYRVPNEAKWKFIDSANCGIFELSVGEPMANELLARVEKKDQFDTSTSATDEQWHTLFTARTGGETFRQGFLDMPGAGDVGNSSLFAKLYFLARSIEALSTDFRPTSCR